jgi:hypothetical protein
MTNASFLWQTMEAEFGPLPDENKWNILRAYRNELLAQSDWSQLGDTPFTAEQKNAWTSYRQTLRDIPQDYTNPNDAMFPEVPA